MVPLTAASITPENRVFPPFSHHPNPGLPVGRVVQLMVGPAGHYGRKKEGIDEKGVPGDKIPLHLLSSFILLVGRDLFFGRERDGLCRGCLFPGSHRRIRRGALLLPAFPFRSSLISHE